MQTFLQFLSEDHLGFLHAKTGRDMKGDYNNAAIDNHNGLALKHHLTKDRHNPGADAVRNGHVRYYHHPDEHEAGYEFIDTPTARKHVSNHLSKSGGFRHIYIDQSHPNRKRTSHEFRSVEDARKHLNKEE